MAFLFALAVFLNAALLFAVQPMVAKMILPVLGGTPAVWNTCMVFFQAALLAGYALAHALSSWLSLGKQVAIYPLFQLLAFATLPVVLHEAVHAAVPNESNPIPWLLRTLLVVVGLPFLVVATTGPLLQRWFGSTDHPEATDPYFLYAGSNLGSMLALISYPIVLEPTFSASEQTQLWAMAYGVLVLLTTACAMSAFGRRRTLTDIRSLPEPARECVTASRRFRWVALAFVPSSLMLGVTTYLTNDIGSIPLLWVIPLGLYLLSFTVAFSRQRLLSGNVVSKMVPGSVIVLTILLLSDAMQPPVSIWLVLHLAVFFILALFCHSELAQDRPSAVHLTEFYLWIALGGVLGGAFNALAAPLIFTRVLEYPVAVVLVCLLRHPITSNADTKRQRWLDWLLPAGLFFLAAGLIILVRNLTWEQKQFKLAIMFGLPALLCYLFVDRPRRFALGIAVIFLAALFVDADPRGTPLITKRSFFGVLRVTGQRRQSEWFYQLVHGNTFHGRQKQNPAGRPEPLSYYHQTGPIGHVFRSLKPRLQDANIGVIGLGVGAMAWYAEPGQHWTFYEIDPAVKEIAENTDYFRFLQTCLVQPTIVLGDARLRLRDAPDEYYDLLVLDAFSSDAVPIHLLTREAMQLYLKKLKPNGVLAFHISNRYLDIKPVLAALANDAGVACRYSDDFMISPTDVGKDPSQWVVMAHKKADWGDLTRSVRWFEMNDVATIPVWTDDFSNILSIVRWQLGSED